jgi:DNA (cytosine-5)-methyltransferase 1
MSRRPKLLDLFCGAGGAGMGYYRAGFDVYGVDIEDHRDYPAPLRVEDALTVLDRVTRAGHELIFTRPPIVAGWGVDAPTWVDPSDFDAIHASPPCQGYTTMSNRWRGAGGKADGHGRLIGEVRELLKQWGGPYVIENVPGARPHMHSPVTLAGGAFGLGVERPRLFESNVALSAPPRVRVADPLGVYGKAPDGRRLFTRKDGSVQRAARSLEEGAAAMGIDWMTKWEDVTEAIPPAYTEHIGRQLLAHIKSEAAA